MTEVKNKVIIWGVDNRNTLGMLRELGSYGIDVFFLVKGKGSMAIHSKYCKEYAETSSVEDGMEYLLNNFKSEEFKPIILTPGDGISVFMDEHRDEMEPYFILPTTMEKNMHKKYTDKYNMAMLAEKVGINFPKTISFTKETSLDDVWFPCLIKPAHEKENHYNEFKFKICKNRRQLEKVQKMIREDSEFVLQEYIERDYELVVRGIRAMDGSVKLCGGINIERMSESGFSSYGKINKDVFKMLDAEKISEYVSAIGYYGPFGMEFGVKDGKAYFFEINLRNDATSYLFFKAGAGMLAAYVYSCAGLDYSHISTNVEKDICFIDDIFDFENVIIGKLSRKTWKAQMEKADICIYYSDDDPTPWKYINNSKWKLMIKDIIVKRFRMYIVFVLDKIGIRK